MKAQRMARHLSIGILLVSGLVIRPLPGNAQKQPAASPYVGDWAGLGWGWEVRFKSSQLGGVTSDKNVMTLTVRHLTRFNFTVDKGGNIAGSGEITYDLDPNLCGVARVTQQVNEAINLMAKLPDFMKQGASIAQKATEYFDAKAMIEETALDSQIQQWDAFRSSPRPVITEQWFNADDQPRNVIDLAKSVWEDRCTTGAPVILVGGLTCDDLRKGPFGGAFTLGMGGEEPADFWDKTVEWLYDKIKDKVEEKVQEGLKERVKETFKAFDQGEEQEKAACEGSPTLTAGTAVNAPSAASLGKVGFGALSQMAKGGVGAGTLMSVPGVTQVSYEYKGLVNGPESRRFKIKGNVVGDKMYLHLEGDVYEGSTDLVVEYSVNYRKSQSKFPAWSPYIDDRGADVQPSGTLRVLQHQVVKDKSGAPHDILTAQDTQMGSPFAVFHQTGTHRNGVQPWQEYEYFWYAAQVTQPKPGK
jgi:hypothetical protein